jgi:hypothetical protein
LREKIDWEVWIDWYEDRLYGRVPDQELEVSRVSLPDPLWEQGPKAVNAEIRRLIDEAMKRRLPEETSLPKQTPRAAIFQLAERGVIGLAPLAPTDRLADTEEVRDFYSEVREKLSDVISLSPNMLGNRLDRTARRFHERLPQRSSEAIERLVWSSGNTLRSILAGHDGVYDDRDPHPDKLDPAVAARLRDLIDTFNQLTIADPALRQRDASRPGPQEHERSVGEINIVVEIATYAAADRTITTSEAGDELSQSIERTIESGSALPDRLAVELARDTHRNFFAATMAGTYRTVRSAARGEGGFVSKELIGGVYGAISATALAAAISARWEIIQSFLRMPIC